jgi:hypothetical protein
MLKHMFLKRNTKTYRSIVDKTDGATNCRVKPLMVLKMRGTMQAALAVTGSETSRHAMPVHRARRSLVSHPGACSAN